jgi:hypothetical protein
MSVVLLVGAGLFVGTLRNLERVNVGFNAQNLLLFRVNPITLRYDAARTNRLYDQMIERINAIPRRYRDDFFNLTARYQQRE